MKILTENPFRILGVFANASRKDVVANKGKMAAFLKVGRSVSFPLDLTDLLGNVNRTGLSVNDAESHLAIAKEQLKYAQFWFLKMTQLDDIAFNHLFAGDAKQAIEIWNKQDSISSLQNRFVVYLAFGKKSKAVSMAEKLYQEYSHDYLKTIGVSDTLSMTKEELSHQFIDLIGEEIGMMTLLAFVSNSEWKSYIKNKIITPLIQKISSEVERAKRIDHKDVSARYEAGKSLMNSTKEALSQLKQILPSIDMQYQMIADKLGIEVLQCGIDYYNNSDDADAAHKAMELQSYAASVAVGKQAKDRCEENVKILKKIIDNLPPAAVFLEDKAIKDELARYTRLPDKISYAIDLLNKTKPHVQNIKTKLGATNSYYLKISTLIVQNALHNVIEEVNAAQEPLARISELLSGMNPYLRSSLLSGSSLNIDQIRNKIKATLSEAWRAIRIMDGFDLESGFRSRYQTNRNSLQGLCNQLQINTSTSSGEGCMVMLCAIFALIVLAIISL